MQTMKTEKIDSVKKFCVTSIILPKLFMKSMTMTLILLYEVDSGSDGNLLPLLLPLCMLRKLISTHNKALIIRNKI